MSTSLSQRMTSRWIPWTSWSNRSFFFSFPLCFAASPRGSGFFSLHVCACCRRLRRCPTSVRKSALGTFSASFSPRGEALSRARVASIDGTRWKSLPRASPLREKLSAQLTDVGDRRQAAQHAPQFLHTSVECFPYTPCKKAQPGDGLRSGGWDQFSK